MEIIKVGDKYNRLTAVKFSHKKRTDQFWLFRCDCGNKKVIRVASVKRENSKSCGCLMKKGNNFRHGMENTKTYKSWVGIKGRCLNKNDTHYKNWGGRGIKICDRWLTFENFYADMGKRPDGKTLDRINNNGNYCKENCKWSTSMEQNNNNRHNHFLTYKNKRMTISQWARELNMNRATIQDRLKLGWDMKRILTNKKYNWQGDIICVESE